MENPEEVLQALDEFQKMRPSEIPRELEDYLCWVAKTGDPFYHWSLVKPLFIEKLTRVMTDFYESCPSLELAPCPNVDQFNYDLMKCGLLELLDSFSNAPFTVQRLCELLTTPRKEYNRVDKFMRAIEKNILVVSTMEPGSTRHSENGEVMVNGTVDEDASSSQPTHDVEMETWVKDCTTESSVAVSTPGPNIPPLDTVLPAKVSKMTTTDDESLPVLQDKNELNSSQGETNTGLDTSCHEIPNSMSLSTPAAASENTACDAGVESSPGNAAEVAAPSTTDVPDAIMNEDTSSQPSLDSEVDEGETGGLRKLQTTFQTKDFIKEDKSPKFYADEPKEEKLSRPEVETEARVAEQDAPSSSLDKESIEKPVTDGKLSFECQDTAAPGVEGIQDKRPRSDSEDSDPGTSEKSHSVPEEGLPSKKACSVISHSETAERSEGPAAFLESSIASKMEEKEEEAASRMKEDTIAEPTPVESCAERLSVEESSEEEHEESETKEESNEHTEEPPQETEEPNDTTETQRPIVEEPSYESESGEGTANKSPQECNQQPSEGGITIEEAMDDETRVNKSVVPDPIPIVEEPKEPEPTVRDSKDSTTITELPDESDNSVETAETPEMSVIAETTVYEEESGANAMNEEIPVIAETSPEDITDVRSSTIEPEEKIDPGESMEVDGDETINVFPQDEPMEQEPGDSIKS